LALLAFCFEGDKDDKREGGNPSAGHVFLAQRRLPRKPTARNKERLEQTLPDDFDGHRDELALPNTNERNNLN
jgi:hypothetical protein